MVRKMLSFDRGTPIAHGLDKKGNKILTIHITEDQDEPDIQVDKLEDIIDEDDIIRVAKLMRLLSVETKMIRKALRNPKEQEKLNDRLKLVIETLKEVAIEKLKKNINFDRKDIVQKIVPAIGGGPTNFDRSIFLTGPSGSGKTFLAKEIMKHDIKKRPMIVFSKIDDDESLKELTKLKLPKSAESSLDLEKEGGQLRLIKIRLHGENDLLDLPCNEDLKNCVCFFDDIDSFPRDIASFLNEYRDSILECGRHHNISVLSTSHQLYNWCKTRVILNESELVCLFPHSNKRNSMLFLRDRMGLDKVEVSKIMRTVMDSGRSLVCRMSAPNAIIHEKGVILL